MTDAKRAAMIAEVEALPPGRFVPVQTLAHSFTREELLSILTANRSPIMPTAEPLTDAVLVELRQTVERMTPLPWHDDGYRIYGPTRNTDKRSGRVLCEYKHLDDPNHYDYAAIILLRNHAAALLAAAAENERLRAEAEALEVKWKHFNSEATAWCQKKIDADQRIQNLVAEVQRLEGELAACRTEAAELLAFVQSTPCECTCPDTLTLVQCRRCELLDMLQAK